MESKKYEKIGINVTDKKVYLTFKNICKKKGLKINKTIELLMQDFIKRNGGVK